VCRRRVGQNRSDSRQSLLAADMSSLQGYVDRRVFLVLQDGRAIVVRVNSFFFFVESSDCWWISDINLFQGILAGFDQKSNIVLSDCKERVFSMDDGVEEIPLGLYLVKGDMMYVIFFSLSRQELWLKKIHFFLFDDRILIGELDEAIDNSTDLPSIRADPILPIRYWSSSYDVLVLTVLLYHSLAKRKARFPPKKEW